jgi:anthranilate synthase component II
VIIIIDNYDSFTYNLFQQVAPLVSEEVRVIRNDAITVAELAECAPSAIIISPGPSRPESAGISIPLIQQLAPAIPILGVCLGMQAMGIAFGGEVIRARRPIHGKSSFIFHRGQGLFTGLPLPLEVGRYHSLIVERQTLPAALTIEAESADQEIMAVSHRDYPCHGLQFHPESILTPKGTDLMRNFLALRRPSC